MLEAMCTHNRLVPLQLLCIRLTSGGIHSHTLMSRILSFATCQNHHTGCAGDGGAAEDGRRLELPCARGEADDHGAVTTTAAGIVASH